MSFTQPGVALRTAYLDAKFQMLNRNCGVIEVNVIYGKSDSLGYAAAEVK
jgi:hypothetical protein